MLSFVKDTATVVFMAAMVTMVVLAIGYGAEYLNQMREQGLQPTPAEPEVSLQTVVEMVAVHHGEAINKLEALQRTVDQLSNKLDKALGQDGPITEL